MAKRKKKGTILIFAHMLIDEDINFVYGYQTNENENRKDSLMISAHSLPHKIENYQRSRFN